MKMVTFCIIYSTFFLENKERKLLEIIKNVPGTGVVYVRSRNQAEVYSKRLQNEGITASFYHGGLSKKEKKEQLQNWILLEWKTGGGDQKVQ